MKLTTQIHLELTVTRHESSSQCHIPLPHKIFPSPEMFICSNNILLITSVPEKDNMKLKITFVTLLSYIFRPCQNLVFYFKGRTEILCWATKQWKEYSRPSILLVIVSRRWPRCFELRGKLRNMCSLYVCKSCDRNYVAGQAMTTYNFIYLWLIQWHCQFILCNIKCWDDQGIIWM
jgi:hypothetical protein